MCCAKPQDFKKSKLLNTQQHGRVSQVLQVKDARFKGVPVLLFHLYEVQREWQSVGDRINWNRP